MEMVRTNYCAQKCCYLLYLLFAAPPVPPRQFENSPAVGTKLEGLLLNEFEQDNDFDPRSYEHTVNNSTQMISNTNGNATSPPLRKFKVIFSIFIIVLVKYLLNLSYTNPQFSSILLMTIYFL